MELRITSSFRIQAVRATFFGLPAEPLVEVPDDGVVATGCQHVQGGTNSGAPTPDCSSASHRAAVAVEGSHSDQSGDLPAVQRAQLRQIREKIAQQVVLLTPYRTTLYPTSQVGVQVAKLPYQPLYVGRCWGVRRRWCSGGSSPRPAWSPAGACERPAS